MNWCIFTLEWSHYSRLFPRICQWKWHKVDNIPVVSAAAMLVFAYIRWIQQHCWLRDNVASSDSGHLWRHMTTWNSSPLWQFSTMFLMEICLWWHFQLEAKYCNTNFGWAASGKEKNAKSLVVLDLKLKIYVRLGVESSYVALLLCFFCLLWQQ